MNPSIIGIPLALTIAYALSTGGGAMADECASPTLVNSLPTQSLSDSDTITVLTIIQGRPTRLLIGTADTTQLWNTQAEKLDLALLEGRRMMDGGGRFSEDVARVKSLTLGSMETGNFFTQISPDPAFAGSDGVLGTDMMMRYDIDLDFAHQRMNYFTPEQCEGAGVYWAPGKVTPVKMTAYAEVVFVPVNLDGHTIVAALDTTADKTFLNPRLAGELFELNPESQEPATVRDSGALLRAGMHEFSSLTFGGLTFNNPQIAIPFDTLSQDTREFHANRTIANRYRLSQMLPDMIIGMDVLRQTHLYISFQNQRVYVSAAGDGQALTAAPAKTSWFNVWRHGYNTYLYPGRRPFFGL